MNENVTRTSWDDAPRSELTPAAASRLLRLGKSGPRRWVDDLVDRLGEKDAVAWFTASASRAGRWIDAEEDDLIQGRTTLEQFTELKRASKKAMDSATTRDDALTGRVGYFIAVGGALLHHGTLISGRRREAWDEEMIDLASLLKNPWRPFFEAAASVTES